MLISKKFFVLNFNRKIYDHEKIILIERVKKAFYIVTI